MAVNGPFYQAISGAEEGLLKRTADKISPLIFMELMLAYRKNQTKLLVYFFLIAGVMILIFFSLIDTEIQKLELICNVIIMISGACSTLAGGAYASSSLSGEKEKKTLTLLRVSGLSSFKIISGKIITVFAFMAAPFAPFALLMLLLPLFGDIGYAKIFGGIYIWTAMTLFFLSLAAFISLLFQKNSVSNSVYYVFLFLLHFMIAIPDSLFFSRTNDYYFNVKFFASFSPFEIWSSYARHSAIASSYSYRYEINVVENFPDYIFTGAIFLLLALLICMCASNMFESYLRWKGE